MASQRDRPPNHVSVQEAGKALHLNAETLRNWLRHDPPKIAGKIAHNTDSGRPEYWVQVSGDSSIGPTLEQKITERSQVATRGDLDASEQSVGSKIDRQREELREGQIEILKVVQGIAESLERQAKADEHVADELSNLNRWLELLQSGAQKDRYSLYILLEDLVRRGGLPPLDKAPEIEEESEAEEQAQARPWYRRWFQKG